MKRTSSSSICESVEEDYTFTHPLSKKGRGADPNTPPTLDSFSILVSDTQNLVVNLLDRGTKQSLAITCKEMLARYYDFDLSMFPDIQPFNELVGNGHIFYLKNCIKLISLRNKYIPETRCHHLVLTAEVMADRWDITEFLEWFINLYFYNTVEGIVIEKRLYSRLVKTFLMNGNIKGFQWMMTQPWYNVNDIFPLAKRDKYHAFLANSGNVDLVIFLMEKFEGTGIWLNTPAQLYELVKVNAWNNEGPIFNWSLLFNCNDEWKAWWLNWQVDETLSGFFAFIVNMGNSWITTDEGYIWTNIYQLWPALNAQIKRKLLVSAKVDPFRLDERRGNTDFITLTRRLTEMGFEFSPETIQATFENRTFFDKISTKTTEVMDWVWDTDSILVHSLMSICKKKWLSNVSEWMESNDDVVVKRAITWLKAHRNYFFQPLADFMLRYLQLRQVQSPQPTHVF